jgi:hypothetical protein
MLLPYSKMLVPKLWSNLNDTFQTNPSGRVELNFVECFDSKRYYSEPNVVEYDKDSKL